MSYLLDTNIISELKKPNPNSNVLAWFANTPDTSLYLSVITLGEIRRGVEQLPQNAIRKESLRIWLEHELPAWFGDRILDIDQGVCECWGKLLAYSKLSIPAIDSLIMATAIQHKLRIVTRNAKDFPSDQIEIINPFEV